jgi:hypothetical protein
VAEDVCGGRDIKDVRDARTLNRTATYRYRITSSHGVSSLFRQWDPPSHDVENNGGMNPITLSSAEKDKSLNLEKGREEGLRECVHRPGGCCK